MKKKIPKNTRLTKKRISSFIFQKFLPTREVFFGNNYKIYNLSSKRNKDKKPKKKEQKKANYSQKEKQIFKLSENNSNKIELDYLNFSQMDIDIYRNNRSFEDDIFSSTLKLDSDKRKITFLRYENENKNYFNHLNGNDYNEELQLSTKIIKKDEEEASKTSSTICNYYNKSQVTPIQKGKEKNSQNKIEEIQTIISNHIPKITNNNNNNVPKEKKDFRQNKNIKDIFIVGFKNNEIVDKIRSSTFENEEININKNNNNKNIKPKLSKKQNKNNKKKNNNNEIKLNIPFKNNLINDYMRNKIKIHNYKNRFGVKYYNKKNKKDFLKEKFIPSNKVNLTSLNNNTCHKTEENNNSVYKKRNFSLLINEAKILKISKSRHKNIGTKNDNSNSKKYLLSKIDSMIKENNNNIKKNKNVINNIKKKSLNNFSFKNFKLQTQINTLDINNNQRKNSKNKKIHDNNSLNLHSFNNLKNTLIKTLTKTNLPIIIKKNNIKKKSNSKPSKNKAEQMSIVPYRLKSKRKNSVGSSLINKIYTKKNKTNFKNNNYILKKSVLPRKKFSFNKMQITPRGKLVERIKEINSMNIGKKLFVDLSQKNEIVTKECNTENKKKFIKKSNSIKNPVIRTDWKKNKYNKNNNNNSSNLKKYKLFNTLNEWKINNEINAKQKTDVGEPSEMGPNNYLNKMNLISSDESDKENELLKI